MKRGSLKRPLKVRNTYSVPPATRTSGSFEQHRTGRERPAVSRALNHNSEYQKRRSHEITKSSVHFDGNDVVVRRQVISTAGEDRLRSRRQLRAVQDLLVGTS